MMPDGKLGLIDYGACMRLERKPDTTDHFEKGVNGLWVSCCHQRFLCRYMHI